LKANIKAISYYLPKKTLTNKELCRIFPQLTEEDIIKRTGIKTRHVVTDGMVGSDLAFHAANKLFKENAFDRSNIDFLIFCTEGLDYKGPATACILQNRLQLSTTCGALDIPFGCTGFTYCLSVAASLIESEQASTILVLNSDIPSTVIHPEDAELRMLFGDAGAATLVTKCHPGESGIGKFSFGTDGSGASNLIVKSSGVRDPVDTSWLNQHKNAGGMKFGRMEMNALEIFTFSLRVVPPMVSNILTKNNVTKDDIDLFVFHQANIFLLNVLRKKLKIDESKFFIFMENIGNTVSASIPIALHEAIQTGKAKKGDKILLAAFGIGYSWSGTVLTI